jgi:hypothetical protein
VGNPRIGDGNRHFLKRRDVIAMLGGSAVAVPVAAPAQQPTGVRRVGVLLNLLENDLEAQRLVTVFREGLAQSGWSDGRGRGAATDVPGNPIADRAAAGTARAGMTRRSQQMRRTTTAEVRPDAGRATRLSASARETGGLTACRARGTRSEGTSMASQRPGIRGMWSKTYETT